MDNKALRPEMKNQRQHHLTPRANVKGKRTCLPRVEPLLDVRKQVRWSTTGVLDEVGLVIRQPLVSQHLLRCWSLSRVDGETLSHEVARNLRDIHPVLFRLEFVVTNEDGFHLKLLSVTIKWSVTCTETGFKAMGRSERWEDMMLGT